MTFSPAQHEAVINKINSGMRDIPDRQKSFADKVNELLDSWWVTEAVGRAIKMTAEKILNTVTWIAEKVWEVIQGAAAPATMFFYANDWQDKIRSRATSVAGETNPKALKAPLEWEGRAADRYASATWRQSGAASQIGKVADTVGQALTYSSVAGLAFYVSIGAIVVKTAAVVTAASAATATGVGAPVGLLAALGSVLSDATYLVAAISALAALLGTQAQQLNNVKGEVRDGTAFEGGHWPKGTA
jgi:hypothetical protein